MAKLEVKFHEDRFDIISQVFCCTIHDSWENRKAWFVILRSLRAPTTGKPAVVHRIVVDTGKLKAVLVTAATDVVNIEIVEKQELGSGVVVIIATVIDVDTIVKAVANLQVMQNYIPWADQMEAFVTAANDRRRLTSGATDPNGGLRTPMQIIEE